MFAEKNSSLSPDFPEDLSSLVRSAARALGHEVGVSEKNQKDRILAELNSIVSSLADAILIFDNTGQAKFLNSGAEKYFGPSSLLQQTNLFTKPVLWQIDDGRPSSPFTRECLFQVMNDQTSRVTEVANLQNPESPQWFLANLSPILNEADDALGVVLALTDITAIKKRQNQRNGRFKELFDDLKTPLTIIRGYTQIFAEQFHNSHELALKEEQVEAILSSIDRIERILSELSKSEKI